MIESLSYFLCFACTTFFAHIAYTEWHDTVTAIAMLAATAVFGLCAGYRARMVSE